MDGYIPVEKDIQAATSQWDADTLVKVISEALKRGDFKGVTAGIRVLATVDPGRAQDVLDTIQAGLAIREVTA